MRPSGFFAFRTPALPMATLVEWGHGVRGPAADDEVEAALAHDRELLTTRLWEITERPEVQAALAVASPDLIDGLTKDSDRALHALVRYVSRMAARPTPFGLFAGCGVGTIADKTDLTLPDRATWRRHSRLDGHYLDSLLRRRTTALRDRLIFHPNETLHLLGGRWHLVAARPEKLERIHTLVDVADSVHLRRALDAAAGGATLAEVTAAVAVDGLDADRAAAFARDMADRQVLVPTVSLPVTGPQPLDGVITDLEALGDAGTVTALTDVRSRLAMIDHEGPASPAPVDGVADCLIPLGAEIERTRLLQVDMTIPGRAMTLARSTAADIARGVELLHRLSRPQADQALDDFREAFVSRYQGGQAVPLLEALDEELGVGFPPKRLGRLSPLLDGLRLPPTDGGDVHVGRRERHLLTLLNDAIADGTHEIVLTAADLDALAADGPPPLPPALQASAVLARTDKGPRIMLQAAMGPSGVSMLGRFCHADPDLTEHVRAHLRAEEALDPDADHAEIVHLASGRMLNVTARPVLRHHEIEWRGRSGAPDDGRIAAADLLLSLERQRFVLRSATTGRRVLPRLASAHNVNRRSPGVYRFLAALQYDGYASALGWSWAPYDSAPFTPRVRQGLLILAPARWRVGEADIRQLDQDEPTARWQAVQTWREQRRLPRWVTLSDDDNRLAVDLDNVVMVDSLVRLLRRRTEAVIAELFPGPDELVAHGPDGMHAAEIVVPFVASAAPAVPDRRPTATPDQTQTTASVSSMRRVFGPGTEWTYLKLYTGTATADRLLQQRIMPLVADLVGPDCPADRWFFMRSCDPGHHLRVRFCGDADELRAPLEALITTSLDDGVVHDAYVGTYHREIERYGGPDAIELAEEVFWADSDAVGALLGMFEPGDAGLDERWRIGLVGAVALMEDLGLGAEARLTLCQRMRGVFQKEFKADTRLRKQIGVRFRSEQEALEALLDEVPDGAHPLEPGLAVLAERSRRLASVAARLGELDEAGRLTCSIADIAQSQVHMWLNRLCRNANRFHEYVIYEFLARLLRQRAARARTQAATMGDR